MSDHIHLTSEQVATIAHLFKTIVVPVMAKEHAEEDGRAGAVIDLRNTHNERLLFTSAGTAPEEKFKSYRENARAKNDALEANPNYQTSWEVHRGDLSEPPYPGAIRTPFDDRISISGFTWQRDTIGSLWLAKKVDRITIADVAFRINICDIRSQFIRTCKKLNDATELAAAA